jgi:long-chain acyl-CoA synthetase
MTDPLCSVTDKACAELHAGRAIGKTIVGHSVTHSAEPQSERWLTLATPDSSENPVTPELVQAAVERLTGAGQIFEVTVRTIAGDTFKAFTNAAANFVDLLSMGRAHGDQTFLVFGTQRWTFTEFFARADAAAAALQHDFGVASGDRVAIAMRNCPDWMLAFTAAVSVGAVVVPFNSWGSAAELEFSLANSAAKVLVADAPRAQILAPHLSELATTVILGSADDPVSDDPAVAGLARLSDIVAGSRGRAYTVAKPAPEDTALILYTSGSTGHPKGVAHRHVAVCQAVMHMFLAGYLPLELTGPVELGGGATADAQLLTVPLFHATGLCGGFVIPCAVGQKVAILRKWDAVRALQVIEAEKITIMSTVPAVVKDLLTHPDFDSYDTSSLTRLAAVGAATPADLPELMEKKIGSSVRSAGFGMTESMGVAATMSGPLFDLRPTSAGILSPIIEMRFADPSGDVLPDGEEGEIQIRGITLTPGYWGPDQLSRDAFTDDGWYRTGDVGQLEPDGYLYITGRIKEMVIRGGENVYPAEIENAAYLHPAVKEAAVFGVPDPRLGEELALVCYLQPGSVPSEDDLRDYLATVLPTHKVPRYITFTGQPLPRNASEKIHRLEIRNNYLTV